MGRRRAPSLRPCLSKPKSRKSQTEYRGRWGKLWSLVLEFGKPSHSCHLTLPSICTSWSTTTTYANTHSLSSTPEASCIRVEVEECKPTPFFLWCSLRFPLRSLKHKRYRPCPLYRISIGCCYDCVRLTLCDYMGLWGWSEGFERPFLFGWVYHRDPLEVGQSSNIGQNHIFRYFNGSIFWLGVKEDKCWRPKSAKKHICIEDAEKPSWS